MYVNLSDIGRNAGCTFDYDCNPATPKTECKEWQPLVIISLIYYSIRDWLLYLPMPYHIAHSSICRK